MVEGTDANGEEEVTVTVTYPYQTLFDYTPTPDNARGVAVARLEVQ